MSRRIDHLRTLCKKRPISNEISENGLKKDGGADKDRTGDLLNAIEALYQLSYDPIQSVLNLPRPVAQSQSQFRGFAVAAKIFPSGTSSLNCRHAFI